MNRRKLYPIPFASTLMVLGCSGGEPPSTGATSAAGPPASTGAGGQPATSASASAGGATGSGGAGAGSGGGTDGAGTGGNDAGAGTGGDAGAGTGGDAGDGGPPPAPINVDVPILPGAFCRYGGVWHETGVDDGTNGGVAGDGILQPGEITSRALDCTLQPDPTKLAAQGLDQPPLNTTCKAPSGTSRVTGVSLQPAFTSLVFPPDPDCLAGIDDTDCGNAFRPVAIRQHPVSRAFYLAQQNGRIVRFSGAPGATQVDTVLDIRDKVVFAYEPGLLSLDFDPAHPEYAFVTYDTCASQSAGVVTDDSLVCADGEGVDQWLAVSRFTLDAGGALDPLSERLVVEMPHAATEHNGGGVLFGPDGYLYIATGDGGAFPNTEAQDGLSYNGKILRVDVHTAGGAALGPADPPFRVPPENPHVGDPTTRPEVFARGLRNPWRYSFDPTAPLSSPRLWVGDVGMSTAEEIDLVQAGDNLGWPLMEGNYCRATGDGAGLLTVLAPAICQPPPGLTAPVWAARQGRGGVAVTGGFVYRGSAIPSLVGKYVFADFSLGIVRTLEPDGVGGYTKRTLLDSTLLIGSFAEDLAHELYVMDWWSGNIDRLVPVNASNSKPATLLSQTGCVDPADPWQPAPGAIRYDVNMPFFSEEGIYKSRYLYLPPGTGMTEYDHTGSLILQPGAVLVKTMETADRKVETRVLFQHADSEWSGWSYRWNSAQTDAVLLDQGLDETIENIAWRFPEQGECKQCHTYPTGRVLGLRVEQLNGVSYYAQTGRFANQLDTLRALGLIDRVVPVDPTQVISATNAIEVPLPASTALPAYPAITDPAPLRDRVGAYLQSNCAHCHQPAGGGRGTFDLRATSFTSACNAPLEAAVYDDASMRVVVPGDPNKSMIYRRMIETQLPYPMHPFRSSVDTAGAALVKSWILGTAAADCQGP
jgi:hypothetical protein